MRIKLYREQPFGDVIVAGLVKRPDFWYIAIPFWISLRKQTHERDDAFAIEFGRRYYEFCIVFRKKDIFHLKRRAIWNQKFVCWTTYKINGVLKQTQVDADGKLVTVDVK